MTQLIQIAPVFKEKMWGGTRLKEVFDFDIPSEKTGECWAVSALSDGDCRILDKEYQHLTLSQFYKQHREAFGECEHEEFPLMIKIIDAHHDLSIQVHPDDAMAKRLGLKHGKAEAWLVLDCAEPEEIILGHTCKSSEELEMILQHPTQYQWLNQFSIRPNQFFYLPGGTVHGVKANTLLYEVQQNSDVSYRIYDYERYDNEKHKRQLHLKEALEAIKVPDLKREAIPTRLITSTMKHTIHLRADEFVVQKFEIDEETIIEQNQQFMILGFLTAGSINGRPAKAGDHFIALSSCKKMKFSAGSTVIATYIPKEGNK